MPNFSGISDNFSFKHTRCMRNLNFSENYTKAPLVTGICPIVQNLYSDALRYIVLADRVAIETRCNNDCSTFGTIIREARSKISLVDKKIKLEILMRNVRHLIELQYSRTRNFSDPSSEIILRPRTISTRLNAVRLSFWSERA